MSETEVVSAAPVSELNPHAAIVARHAAKKAEKERQEREALEAERVSRMEIQSVPMDRELDDEGERPGEAEKSRVQEQVVENKINPHAAIIARHAARKAEKDREEREAAEKAAKESSDREAKLTRKESVIKKQEELQQRAVELLAVKPLEPKCGDLLRYEGGLKGWKSRLFYIEDKLPLTLLVYKQNRNDGEFLDGYELTSETVLEDQGMTKWGSQSNIMADDGKGTMNSKKSGKAKPNSFTLTIHDKSIKLATESAELKDEWIECLQQLLTKHHGLVRSVVPTPSAAPGSSSSPAKSHGARKTSTESARPKTRSKSSYSIAEEDEIVNPLDDDEMVGKSFKNDLFDE